MINLIKKKYFFLFFKISSLFSNNIEKKFLSLPYNDICIIKKIKLPNIKYFIQNKYIKNKTYFIWNGNWCKKKKLINQYKNYSINYNSVFQIFKKKINYKRCSEYKSKLNDLKKYGITARGQKNTKELNLYFEDLIKLHKQMKKSGYKSQQSLNHKIGDEIGVFIGSNGELIKAEDKYGGTHRFALAKILKLSDVYINVRGVHKNFLKKHVFKNMNLNDNELIIKNKIKIFLKKYE